MFAEEKLRNKPLGYINSEYVYFMFITMQRKVWLLRVLFPVKPTDTCNWPRTEPKQEQ